MMHVTMALLFGYFVQGIGLETCSAGTCPTSTDSLEEEEGYLNLLQKASLKHTSPRGISTRSVKPLQEKVVGAAGGFLAPHKSSKRKVDFGLHDALMMVQKASRCEAGLECQKDQATILAILSLLIILLMLIFAAFFFFREDKEEQVTPLCPQLVVRDSALTFKIALDPLAEKLEVLDHKDDSQCIAKVAMDWPDPFRPCASGIASTARLQNSAGMNLATVVARNVAVSGQALALCRSGCEIFGFVEPDTAMRYHVRHRTGVHLLTLVGDFSTWHVDGVNPAGAVVFSAKKEGNFCVGKVQQHVDAGLLICCIVAAHIHRVLQQPPHGSCTVSPPPYISMNPNQLMDQSQRDAKSKSPRNSNPSDSLRQSPISNNRELTPRGSPWASIDDMAGQSPSLVASAEAAEEAAVSPAEVPVAGG